MFRGAADLDGGNYSEALWPHNVKVRTAVKTQTDLFHNNALSRLCAVEHKVYSAECHGQ